MPEPLDPQIYRDLVRHALAEDIGTGDVTTRAIVPAGTTATGEFLAKASCVVAGLDVAREVFRQIDPSCEFVEDVHDGERAIRALDAREERLERTAETRLWKLLDDAVRSGAAKPAETP